MKKSTVVKLVSIAHCLWPNWKPPESEDALKLLVDSWASVLEDIDDDDAIVALHALSTAGRDFVPPVGLIRQEALRLRSMSDGTNAPDVDEAWAEVRSASEQRGYASGPPDWSHPAVADAVAAIGWRELCLSTNPEALRAHFLHLYGSAVARGNRRRDLPSSIANRMPTIGNRMPTLDA